MMETTDRRPTGRLRPRAVILLVACCAAALVAAGCGSDSSSSGGGAKPSSATTSDAVAGAPKKPASMTTVKLGVTGLGINLYWDLIAADKAGMFAANNLKASFVPISTPGNLVSAAASGSTDFVSVATDTVINAEDKGAPLKIVASEAYGSYDLVAKNSITSWDQLKGKKVGIADPASGSTVLLNALLEKNGLSPKDVTYVPAAATPQRLAALQTGAVDAALLADPANFTAIDTGKYHSLGNTVDAVYPYQITTHSVNQNFAKKNPSAVIAFVTAIQQAHKWLYDPNNKAQATTIFADVAKVPTSVAAKSYQAMFDKYKTMSPTAAIDPKAMQAVYDAMNKTSGQPKDRTDSTYIDNAYLEAAAGVN